MVVALTVHLFSVCHLVYNVTKLRATQTSRDLKMTHFSSSAATVIGNKDDAEDFFDLL